MTKNKHRLLALALVAVCCLPAGQVAAQAADKAGPALPLEYSEKGADTCLQCHNVEPFFRTKHARRDDPRTPFAGLQCEACHGPGGSHAKGMASGQMVPITIAFGPNSKQTAAEQNKPCLGCHERDARVAWKGSEHQASDLACVSCHQLHTARDRMLIPIAQAERCLTCHIRQRGDFYKTTVHPVRYGTIRCSDCHNPHGSGAAGKLLAQSTVNPTCYTCHAEKRGPFLWEHAPVSEDCTLCHTPHGSVYPALLIKPPPLLCQQCHSQAGHPSVAYTPQGLPGGAPSGFLLAGGCINCHSQVHGSNHPSGAKLMR
ncbi:MAG TPA: DmsE family decaheme c-type cytochrome [Burkholderiales bacterium]|nr:DmsE family decaheme c-type cytochrome [Burkholderiales bacterium]